MDEIQPMGTLPLTWKKAFFIIYIHYMVMKYSHLRGKKLPNTPLKKLKKEILPLTWEKDSVFMRHSEVFAAICMKNFYKIFHKTPSETAHL